MLIIIGRNVTDKTRNLSSYMTCASHTSNSGTQPQAAHLEMLKFITDCLQYVRVNRWRDETWVHHYMPEFQWWSVQWKHLWTSPSPKVFICRKGYGLCFLGQI